MKGKVFLTLAAAGFVNLAYAQVDTLILLRVQAWSQTSIDPYNDTLVSFISCDGGNSWNGPFVVDEKFNSGDFGLGATVDKYGNIIAAIFAETSRVVVPNKNGLRVYNGRIGAGCSLVWDTIGTIYKGPYTGTCFYKFYDVGAVGVVYKDIGGRDHYFLYASGFCTPSGGQFPDGIVYMSDDRYSWWVIDTVDWPWNSLYQDNDGSITMFGDSVYIVDWGANKSPRKYACKFDPLIGDLMGCTMSRIDTLIGHSNARYTDIIKDPLGDEWILLSQYGINVRLYKNGSYCFTFEYAPGDTFIIPGEHSAELAASRNGYLYVALWRDNDNATGGGTPSGTVYDSTIILRCNYASSNCCDPANWHRIRGVYGWGDISCMGMSIVTKGEVTLGFDDDLGVGEGYSKNLHNGLIEVYDVRGRVIWRGEGDPRLKGKGVYFIKAGKKVEKVIVR